MNGTLSFLRGGRRWVVSGITIYGVESAVDFLLVLTESGDPARVMFCLPLLGGRQQAVDFESLTDIFGNPLPQSIIAPVVIIIPRSEANCYLIDRPYETGFRICRDRRSTGDAVVDLFIMENDFR